MTEPRGTPSLLNLVEAFTKGVTAVKGIIDLLKQGKELLPAGEQKTSVEKKIEEAERAVQLADAEMGQSLGYRLCRCTWPPQVMLSIGFSEETHTEQIKCPHCGKVSNVPGRTSPTEEVKPFDPYDVY